MFTSLRLFLEGHDISGEMRGNTLPTFEEVHEMLSAKMLADGEDGEEPDEDYIIDVYDLFEELYTRDLIHVYRLVDADSVDLDPYGIGESWTFDRDSIKYFSNNVSGNRKTWKIIEADVPPENVDWKKSIDLFYHFSSLYDTGENELFIPAGSRLLNVTVSNY